MMNQIVNRLKSAIARGIIHLVNDAAGRQFCQITILAGEVKANVERPQHFGFTSNPPPGTAAVIAFIGADRGKPVVIGDNDPATRKKSLKSGESAQYDALGQFVYLKDDGSIEIESGGVLLIRSAEKVRMETAQLEVTGEIIDRVDADGQSMAAMRAVYNVHTHDENDGHDHSPTDEPNQQMGGGA